MSASELQQLKAEEKMMIGIASKLNDQLNRLKVEELELMSKIRARTLEAIPTKTEDDEQKVDMTEEEDLDLDPTISHRQHDEEEEEEEEEDILMSIGQ